METAVITASTPPEIVMLPEFPPEQLDLMEDTDKIEELLELPSEVYEMIERKRANSGQKRKILKNRRRRQKRKVLNIADDIVDWLPADWTAEIRTRKSGALEGQKYKVFLNQVTGFKFYSKRGVLKYLADAKLQTDASDNKLSLLKRESYNCAWSKMDTAVATSSVVCCDSNQETSPDGLLTLCYQIECVRANSIFNTYNTSYQKSVKARSANHVSPQIEYSPVGLPPGWIKETRFRKPSGNRKDMFYIDPARHYVFSSLKAVSRYLESGLLGSCVQKVKGGYVMGKHHVTGEPRARSTVVRRCLLKEMASTPMMMKMGNATPLKKFQPTFKNETLDHNQGNNHIGRKPSQVCQREEEKSFQPLEQKVETLPESTAQPNELTKGSEETSLQSEHIQLHARALDAVEGKKLQSGATHRRRKRCSSGPRGSKSRGVERRLRKDDKLTTGKAKYLEIYEDQPYAPYSTNIDLADIKSRGGLKLIQEDTESLLKSEIQENYEIFGTCKDQPNASSTMDLGLMSERIKNRNDPSTDQGGALKLIEENTHSVMKSPFGYSWPDPCLEFAFKTLTSDIPSLEDTSAVQEYFNQQTISSLLSKDSEIEAQTSSTAPK